jgi:hypothetical protein
MTAAIDDIASALEHPPPPTDGDPTLATSVYARDPGFALFYAYLHRARPDRRWEELGSRFLDSAIAAVPEASHRPFFSYGFSGAGWAVQHLSSWFMAIDDDALTDVDDGLAMLVDQAATVSFDLQHGLVGFGVYALERLPAPGARHLLALVIRRLATLAEEHGAGLRWRRVSALWVEGPDLTALLEGIYTTDVYNGTAGVIGVLAGAIAAGVEPDEARRLLDGALRWTWSALDNGLFRFPVQVGWLEGSLGVAAVTFAASRAAKLDGWGDKALAVAREVFATKTPVRELGLDMGVAGAAHMYFRLFDATGEALFADASRYYLTRLLRRRRATNEGLAGFRGYSPAWQRAFLDDKDFPVGWIGLPGLLGGIAGIGLVLLALLHDQEPAWDRALLLSHR